MSRPIEYDPKICQELIEYFNTDEKDESGKPIPHTIEKFLWKYKYLRSTFYGWIKEYPELMNTFEQVRQKQVYEVLDNSLLGNWNPAISKMYLGNISTYKDKSEVDHKSSDGSMTPVYNFTEKK